MNAPIVDAEANPWALLLPNEILIKVMCLLSVGDVSKCSYVCRRWRAVASNDNLFWRHRCIFEHLLTVREAKDFASDASQPTNDLEQLEGSMSTVDITANPSLHLFRNLYMALSRPNYFQPEVQWEYIKKNGNGWKTDILPSGEIVCATSYGSCMRRHQVDLVAAGLTPSFLDIVQPRIICAEQFRARHDCGSIFQMSIRLLDSEQRPLHIPLRFSKTTPQWTSGLWRQAGFVYEHYGPGLRYVEFVDGGKDTQFWRGHYGAQMKNAILALGRMPAGVEPAIFEETDELPQIRDNAMFFSSSHGEIIF